MKSTRLQCLAILGLVLGVVTMQSQTPRYQIFFVTVGSGWYATPTGSDLHGFERIQGANMSAEIVANALSGGGAEYGVELKAGDGSFVTLSDIDRVIQKVASRMTTVKPINPLLVFYIASHGISEGVAWSHFSVPGDFVYRGDPDHLDIDRLSNSTLYAGTLVDQLEKLHVPFLVILDSCRDGEEKHFEPTVLSAEATRNLNDVGTALRVLNEFRDSYPVLFSTLPGESVRTVTNPLVPDAPVSIGPLARRFSLVAQPYLNKGTELSLSDFLAEMVSPKLDNLTSPAVTHSQIPSGASAVFLAHSASPHTFDVVQGTGSQMQVCCSASSPTSTPSSAKLSVAKGSLSLSGPQGEFVSSGKTLTFAESAFKISITQRDAGDIAVRFEREDTEFDANFSTGSGKRFETKEYTKVQRYDMADAGTPALEVSGDGRGCGEIAGSFKVSEVEYRSDGTISKFAATFEQQCDGSKFPALGAVSVAIK